MIHYVFECHLKVYVFLERSRTVWGEMMVIQSFVTFGATSTASGGMCTSLEIRLEISHRNSALCPEFSGLTQQYDQT